MSSAPAPLPRRRAAPASKSVVHVSAIGADPKSASIYARSKAEGEAAVFETLPDSVVMRPSIMFGPEDHFFNRFAGMARISPALPLIGGGKTRFQPVFVGDVARAIADAVEGKAKPATVYELGGPEVRTFRECMELMLREIERKRLLVPLPWALATALGAILQLSARARLLTVDQVRQLRVDNVVSEAARSARAAPSRPRHRADQPRRDPAVLSLAVPRHRPVARSPARPAQARVFEARGKAAGSEGGERRPRPSVALSERADRRQRDEPTTIRHQPNSAKPCRLTKPRKVFTTISAEMKAATKPMAMIGGAVEIDDVDVLVEVVDERPEHGRHGEEERELRRRALVGAEQQRADDGRARARHARDHRQHWKRPMPR